MRQHRPTRFLVVSALDYEWWSPGGERRQDPETNSAEHFRDSRSATQPGYRLIW